MSITWIAVECFIGGLTFFLFFFHCIGDWIFQSHAEAMAKSKDAKVRAIHCLKYTAWILLPLLPLVQYYEGRGWIYPLVAVIAFSSHYWEDSYKPLVWWFKHLRKHPTFHTLQRSDADAMFSYVPSEAQAIKLILDENALGYILFIAVDQIVHLFFLFLIATIMVLGALL